MTILVATYLAGMATGFLMTLCCFGHGDPNAVSKGWLSDNRYNREGDRP